MYYIIYKYIYYYGIYKIVIIIIISLEPIYISQMVPLLVFTI